MHVYMRIKCVYNEKKKKDHARFINDKVFRNLNKENN